MRSWWPLNLPSRVEKVGPWWAPPVHGPVCCRAFLGFGPFRGRSLLRAWAAPAGSTDLDVLNLRYFDALTNLYGMPVGQFGVY